MSEGRRLYTYSQLQAFQRCEQRYRYGYEDLWEPVWDGPALSIGSAVHKAIELVLLTPERDVEAALAGAQVLYEGMVLGVEALEDAKRQRQAEDGWLQVEAMVKGYPYFGGKGEIKAVEQEFEFELASGIWYGGKIDQIEEVNGQQWVTDTKTTGMEMEKVIRGMRLRPQFPGYVLGARALGFEPVGVILDLIGKPRVYHKVKGGEETGEITVKDATYHREPLVVGEFQLKEFKRWALELIERVESNRATKTWIKNNESCLSFNRVCAFYEMCMDPGRAALMVDGVKFREKERQHQELEGTQR